MAAWYTTFANVNMLYEMVISRHRGSLAAADGRREKEIRRTGMAKKDHV